MKIKQSIACFFFFVSILMLIVPVIPHHHHMDGILCMKNDISTNCPDCSHQTDCGQSHSPQDNHNTCCCNTHCAFNGFIQTNPSNHECDFRPDYHWVNIIYYEPIFQLLQIPEEKQPVFYLESLHGILAFTTQGLRAPPTHLV